MKATGGHSTMASLMLLVCAVVLLLSSIPGSLSKAKDNDSNDECDGKASDIANQFLSELLDELDGKTCSSRKAELKCLAPYADSPAWKKAYLAVFEEYEEKCNKESKATGKAKGHKPANNCNQGKNNNKGDHGRHNRHPSKGSKPTMMIMQMISIHWHLLEAKS